MNVKQYDIAGLHCGGCETNTEKALSSIKGVKKVKASHQNRSLEIESESEIELSVLRQALTDAGLSYKISLPHSADHEHSADQHSHVHHVHAAHQQHAAHHEHKASPAEEGKHSAATTAFEQPAVYYCPMHCEGEKTYEQPGSCPVCGMDLVSKAGDNAALQKAYTGLKRKLLLSLAFTVPVFILAMSEMIPGKPVQQIIPEGPSGWIQLVLSLPVVFYAARLIFEKAWKSVLTGNLNMFTLIGLGAGAAFGFSVFALIAPQYFPAEFVTEQGHVHLYFEAVTVILSLSLLGQVMEARAHSKTNDAILGLMKLNPKKATKVLEDGSEKVIPVEALRLGDRLRIKPGERIPVDGSVLEGRSEVDQSHLTGEPMPVVVSKGDWLNSGSTNTTGALIMQAEKLGSDTLLSKIIELVGKASSSKSPMQKLADRVSKVFVPTVIVVSVITFFVWWALGPDPSLVYALVNAISVLIIACPCALGLATPMSVMVGIGKGAQHGVLIKEAAAIEAVDQMDQLIVDKTGTLTEGKPTVVQLEPVNGFSIEEILPKALGLNLNSEHPVAKAVVKFALERGFKAAEIDRFRSVPGKGVEAFSKEVKLSLGNEALMMIEGVSLDMIQQEEIIDLQRVGKTISYFASGDKLMAYFVIADPIKETSASALAALRGMDIDISIASGDSQYAVEAVARELKIQSFRAPCSPEDKLNWVLELQGKGSAVGMAGDGINDAPALAQADLGIAMGTGTDVALDTAQITLVKGDLHGIVQAVKLSKAMKTNIRQNLFFAFIYNGIGVPIAAGLLYPFFGLLLSPMLAAVAMSFSSVSVIFNALRLRNLKL